MKNENNNNKNKYSDTIQLLMIN